MSQAQFVAIPVLDAEPFLGTWHFLGASGWLAGWLAASHDQAAIGPSAIDPGATAKGRTYMARFVANAVADGGTDRRADGGADGGAQRGAGLPYADADALSDGEADGAADTASNVGPVPLPSRVHEV